MKPLRNLAVFVFISGWLILPMSFAQAGNCNSYANSGNDNSKKDYSSCGEEVITEVIIFTPVVPEEAPIIEPTPIDPTPTPTPQPSPETTPTPEPTTTPLPTPSPEPTVEPQPEIVVPIFQPEPTPVVIEVVPEELPIVEEPLPIPPTPEPIEEPTPVTEPVIPVSKPESNEEISEPAEEPHNETVTLDNGIVLTASVASALELFNNPAELITSIFTNPAEVFTAFANIGADMSAPVREQAEKTVVAAIIVGQIASQAAAGAVLASRRNK